VFCSETGDLLDPDNIRHRAFVPLLKVSGLRQIRFHDLRHTFASLLLQQGESPVYVKEQMGHSSIAITVDLYGHLIPGGNRQAVDRLDEGMNQRWDGAGSGTPAQPEGHGDSAGVGNSLNYWCARQELNLRPAGSKAFSVVVCNSLILRLANCFYCDVRVLGAFHIFESLLLVHVLLEEF